MNANENPHHNLTSRDVEIPQSKTKFFYLLGTGTGNDIGPLIRVKKFRAELFREIGIGDIGREVILEVLDHVGIFGALPLPPDPEGTRRRMINAM